MYVFWMEIGSVSYNTHRRIVLDNGIETDKWYSLLHMRIIFFRNKELDE